VKAGVRAPGRWEWSPYLDLVADGRVDLRPMLTHTFGLEQWREAFLAIANQGESGAVKVAIDFR
jgi:threonine dehydrogenase-like Zn-dependent dehydrogenase